MRLPGKVYLVTKGDYEKYKGSVGTDWVCLDECLEAVGVEHRLYGGVPVTSDPRVRMYSLKTVELC